MSKKPQLDITVEFGGVSIGESTARLSMKIAKHQIEIAEAENAFCARRLTGKVQLGGEGDSPGQKQMFETTLSIEGTFDIHRFGVSEDWYTTGATFKLNEIDIGEFAKFSKGKGRILVDDIGEIPSDVVEEDHEHKESLPGTYATEGEWTEVSLDTLFSGSILKAFKGAGLSTVGDLHNYTQPKSNGFEQRLTDIKGIGESKVEMIENTMMEFWRDNPQEEAVA